MSYKQITYTVLATALAVIIAHYVIEMIDNNMRNKPAPSNGGNGGNGGGDDTGDGGGDQDEG